MFQKHRMIQSACFLGIFAMSGPSLLAADVRAYFHFSGAFHPAVAHFPIALLVVAGVVELWRAIRGKKVPGETGYTCLMLGAAGAVVAAILGWANADHAGEFNGTQADVLFLHRWLGLGVAVGAVLLAIFATRTRFAPSVSNLKRYGLLAGLLLCSALVGLTGSLGGKLTFGVDYYESVYNETIGAAAKKNSVPAPVQTSTASNEPSPAQPVAAATPKEAKNEPAPVAPQTGSEPIVEAPVTTPDPATTLAKVSYVTHIKPLFVTHCTKCHNDAKQKGDYRLDTKAVAFEPGGSGEKPIVPGKADDSLLVKVIEGKGEYKENMMPPKGTILSTQQVALIRRWIDEGAVWDE